MAAPQPDRIQQLFDAVLSLAPEERAAFLARECPDTVSRARLEALIAADGQAGGFLEEPPRALITAAAAEHRDSTGEKRFGAYEVVGELGRGGMGVVYLARRADREFNKLVAIKVADRHAEDGAIRARFLREREILARFDHPNIAMLLDGGTTAGNRPFFVMEYVEGVSIDEYCTRENLTVPQRLALFQAVCDAVQYAHQRLIVHRDIKCRNILVSGGGVLKLLDFGIAKVLDETQPEGRNETLIRALTPHYASPEQIRGEPVTTATDVYSLGVVLYEILTGHRPFESRTGSYRELERAVCEEEPELPSMKVLHAGAGRRDGSIPRQLRGDLDNIVLVAMRKEPGRRYPSVQQLSDDIRRHLEGMPVLAHKDSLHYRTGKFVGRHRTAVAAAMFAGLCLIGGAGAAMYQAHVAGIERAKAERRFHDIRRLANTLLFEVDSAIQNLAGSVDARRVIVAKALEYLDGLAKEAAQDRPLRLDLVEAYEKIGDIQGAPALANLGDTAGAFRSYGKALEIAEELRRSSAPDARTLRHLARIHIRLGDLDARKTLRLAAAAASYGKAVEATSAAVALNPADRTVLRELAVGYSRQGNLLTMTGDLVRGLESYRASLRLFEQVHGSDPTQPQGLSDLGFGEEKVGSLLWESRDPSRAAEHFRKARIRFERAAERDPGNAQYQREIGNLLKMEADAAREYGDRRLALELYRRSLAITERMATADRNNNQLERDQANVLFELGSLLGVLGRTEESRETTARSLAILDRRTARAGAGVSEFLEHSWVLLNCAPAGLRAPRRAADLAQRAYDITQGKSPEAAGTLAISLFQLGQTARAIELVEQALQLLPEPGGGVTPRFRNDLETYRKTWLARAGNARHR